MKHSRDAVGVKGGFAAAHAVMTLDTALSASAHNPNIRGMSVFPCPLREIRGPQQVSYKPLDSSHPTFVRRRARKGTVKQVRRKRALRNCSNIYV
jgi:hypothetical protein